MNRDIKHPKSNLKKITMGIFSVKLAAMSMAASAAPIGSSSSKRQTAKQQISEQLSAQALINRKDIANEIKRAQNKEGILGNSINSNRKAITAEEARATAEEKKLKAGIDNNRNNIKANEDAIAAESSRATTRENDLDSHIITNEKAITDEAARATFEEATLGGRIDNNGVNIKANEGAITAESSRASSRENALDIHIGNTDKVIEGEKSRAKAREDALDSRIVINGNSIKANENAIAAEETRAKAEERRLDDGVNHNGEELENLNRLSVDSSSGDISAGATTGSHRVLETLKSSLTHMKEYFTSKDSQITGDLNTFKGAQASKDADQDKLIAGVQADNARLDQDIQRANRAVTKAEKATTEATSAATAATLATQGVNSKLTTMLNRTSQVPLNQDNIKVLQEEVGIVDSNGRGISPNFGSSHESRIKTLESGQGDQDQRIQGLESSQSNFNSRLTAADSGIERNKNDIEGLRNAFIPLDPQNIANMGSRISANEQDIDQIKTVLMPQSGSGRYQVPGQFAKDVDNLATYSTKLDDLSTRVQNNTGHIGANTIKADLALSQSSQALAEANKLDGTVTSNEGRITTLEGEERSSRDSIRTNLAKIDQLENIFTTTTNEASSALRNSIKNQGDITTLQGDVADNKNNIESLKGATEGIVRTGRPHGQSPGVTTVQDKLVAQEGVVVKKGLTVESGTTSLQDTNIHGSLTTDGNLEVTGTTTLHSVSADTLKLNNKGKTEKSSARVDQLMQVSKDITGQTAHLDQSTGEVLTGIDDSRTTAWTNKKLTGEVRTNSGDISKNKDGILENKGKIAANKSAITQEVAERERAVDENKKLIASNTVDITKNTSEVASNLDKITQEITDRRSAIATAKSDAATDAQTRVDALAKGAVATNSNQIDSVDKRLGTFTASNGGGNAAGSGVFGTQLAENTNALSNLVNQTGPMTTDSGTHTTTTTNNFEVGGNLTTGGNLKVAGNTTLHNASADTLKLNSKGETEKSAARVDQLIRVSKDITGQNSQLDNSGNIITGIDDSGTTAWTNTKLTGEVQTNSGNILKNSNNISRNSVRISEDEKKISHNERKSLENERNISKNEKVITGNQKSIGQNKVDITQEVVNRERAVDENKKLIAGNTVDITKNTSGVASNLDKINQEITDRRSAIATVKSDAATDAQTRVDALAKGAVTANTNQIDSVDKRLGTFTAGNGGGNATGSGVFGVQLAENTNALSNLANQTGPMTTDSRTHTTTTTNNFEVGGNLTTGGDLKVAGNTTLHNASADTLKLNNKGETEKSAARVDQLMQVSKDITGQNSQLDNSGNIITGINDSGTTAWTNTKLTSGVQTNSKNISENKKNITANSSLIAANKSAITNEAAERKQAVAANKQLIDKNTQNIDNNTHNIAALTSSISTTNGTTSTGNNFRVGKDLTVGGKTNLKNTRIDGTLTTTGSATVGKNLTADNLIIGSRNTKAAGEDQMSKLAGVDVNSSEFANISNIAGDTKATVMTNKALTGTVNNDIGRFEYTPGQGGQHGNMVSSGRSFRGVEHALKDINTLDDKQDTHLGKIDDTIKQFNADIDTNKQNIQRLDTRVTGLEGHVKDLETVVGVTPTNLRPIPQTKNTAGSVTPLPAPGTSSVVASSRNTAVTPGTGSPSTSSVALTPLAMSNQGNTINARGAIKSIQNNYQNTLANRKEIGEISNLHTNLKDGSNTNTVTAINKVDDKANQNTKNIAANKTATEDNKAEIAKNKNAIDHNSTVLANRSARNAAAIKDTSAAVEENSREIKANSAKIDAVQDEMRKGLADAAAMSSIKYPKLDTGEAAVGAGYGNYEGANSIAVGLGVQATDNLFVNTSAAATSGADSSVLVGAGVSYKFRLFDN